MRAICRSGNRRSCSSPSSSRFSRLLRRNHEYDASSRTGVRCYCHCARSLRRGRGAWRACVLASTSAERCPHRSRAVRPRRRVARALPTTPVTDETCQRRATSRTFVDGCARGPRARTWTSCCCSATPRSLDGRIAASVRFACGFSPRRRCRTSAPSYPDIVRNAFEEWTATGIPLVFTFVHRLGEGRRPRHVDRSLRRADQRQDVVGARR